MSLISHYAEIWMATSKIPFIDYKMEGSLLFSLSMTDSTTHTVNSVNNRKVSDYDCIIAVVGTQARGTMLLPTYVFKSKTMYIGFMYAGSLREVDVTYDTETTAKILTVGINEPINVYGLKINA